MMGENRCEIAAGLGDNRGPYRLTQDFEPSAQHRSQRTVDLAALLRFATQHGDALAVLTQPRHVAGSRRTDALQ